MNNTLLQPAAFLAMLYGGALIGIAYDLLRIPRRLLHSRFVQALCDGCFVLLAVILAAASLLLASGGDLRVYLLAGMALGFLLEQWSIGYLFFHAFYAIRARLYHQ